MQFVYPDRYKWHWEMLAEATMNNYFVEGDCVVVMGIYLHEDISRIRELYPDSKIIVYQLEPISENNAWWDTNTITRFLRDADEVWDYDLNNIEYLREELGITAFFRPFLFSESCCKHIDMNREKDLDVLFYGYYTEHRSKFVNEFVEHCGRSFAWIAHIHHPVLDEYISRARVVINIHHAENLQQQEQTRLFYLLSNGKDVVSEKSKYNVYGDLVPEAETPQEMAGIVNKLLAKHDTLREQHRKYLFKNLKYDDIYNKFCDE